MAVPDSCPATSFLRTPVNTPSMQLAVTTRPPRSTSKWNCSLPPKPSTELTFPSLSLSAHQAPGSFYPMASICDKASPNRGVKTPVITLATGHAVRLNHVIPSP